MRRSPARTLPVLAALLLVPGLVRAQEGAPPAPGPDGTDAPGTTPGENAPRDQPPGFPGRPEAPGLEPDGGPLDLRDLESWIVLEEEEAPEPPLLRGSFGGVVWFLTRSQLRSDRRGAPGTRLDDLELEQGLESRGASPFAEATIGGRIRGGLDYLSLDRRGRLRNQTEDITFEGVTVARAGQRATANLSFLTASVRVEWDGLYGRTYRLGLLGGLRYFHLGTRLEGPSPTGAAFAVHRSAELLSPFFGGRVELTPFEFLSVTTRVEFMNWSWRNAGLKDARYLDLRIGGTIHFIPGRFGVGLEYRFLFVRAAAEEHDEEAFEGGVSAAGVALYVSLAF